MKKLIFLLIVAFSVASCQRIPLYDADSGVYLHIDIKQIEGTSIPEHLKDKMSAELWRKVEGRTPERMQVNFYEVDSHMLVAKAFVGPQGGYIDVAPGVYDIVVYSIDADATRVSQTERRGDVYAYTSGKGNRVVPQDVGGESIEPVSYPVVVEPDHIYVGRLDGAVIPAHTIVDETVELYTDASTLLETYLFRAYNVTGINNVASVRAYVTGQAQAKCLWDGRYTLGQVIIGVSCQIDPDSGEIFTVFNTFGKYPNSSNKVYLDIVVRNASGDEREYVFDVTDQFDNPDNTNHEIIVSDGIDVPNPGAGSGGFSPDVDDWDEERKDIDI